MPSGILGTALSGLMTFQRASQTVTNNVSNVNTPGYSKQKTEIITAPSDFTEGQYYGTGANVVNVTRNYDQFITGNLQKSTSMFSGADKFQMMAAQIDNAIANSNSGMTNSLKTFFASVNDVANDPSSLAARQVMLTQADSVAHQFNTVSSQLEGFRNQVNLTLEDSVNKVNSLAQGIKDLNLKIASTVRGGYKTPNELLDQRDQMLNKLAEHIDISTLNDQDGSVSVFVGQGQALVMGGTSVIPLSLQSSSTDYGHYQVMMSGQDITSQITSGFLGGTVKFRDQVLDPAQQQLGLVAAGLAVEFNRVHQQGYDLNGVAGKKVFDLGTSEILVLAEKTNGGSGGKITATFDSESVSSLQASDYRLNFDNGVYTLTRLSDNKSIAIQGSLPATVEGIKISEIEAPTGRASFLIRPTFTAARNIASTMTKAEEIAAAKTLNEDGTPLQGDNLNVLELANLEAKTYLVGSQTLSQTYTRLVANVGAATNAGDVNLTAQKAIFNQASDARDNFAGVNLDEEAANLMKFQNAYQAASQVVSISRSMFDSLITAIR